MKALPNILEASKYNAEPAFQFQVSEPKELDMNDATVKKASLSIGTYEGNEYLYFDDLAD